MTDSERRQFMDEHLNAVSKISTLSTISSLALDQTENYKTFHSLNNSSYSSENIENEFFNKLNSRKKSKVEYNEIRMKILNQKRKRMQEIALNLATTVGIPGDKNIEVLMQTFLNCEFDV